MGTNGVFNLRINIIIVGLISAIMLRYTGISHAYYVFLIFLFFLLLFKLVKNSELRVVNSNVFLIGVSVISFFYMFLVSIGDLSIVGKRYLLLFIIFIYLYLAFTRYSLSYTVKFYKQLTILLNICSVLNLYQVIFHKPFLLNYMKLMELGYNYHFGTPEYRTMSVFNHPIVSGLFFILAFLCNLYVVKNTLLKYSLQILLLVNIYTSQSRSAWLAMVFILVFIAWRDRKKIVTLLFRPKLTYMKLTAAVIFLGMGSIFMLFKFQEIYHFVIQRFGDSLSFNSTTGSNIQRIETISLILNHMFNSSIFNLFFGFGAGSSSQFMYEHPILLEGFATTDNQYLAWFYEFGLIGILFYCGLVMFILLKYHSNRKKHWTIELSFACFLVISFMFFFAEGWPVVMIMLTFIISILTFKFKPEELNRRN